MLRVIEYPSAIRVTIPHSRVNTCTGFIPRLTYRRLWYIFYAKISGSFASLRVDRDRPQGLFCGQFSGFVRPLTTTTTRRRTMISKSILEIMEEGPWPSKYRIVSMFSFKIALATLMVKDPSPFASFLTWMPAPREAGRKSPVSNTLWYLLLRRSNCREMLESYFSC